jgi:hypothetical protein
MRLFAKLGSGCDDVPPTAWANPRHGPTRRARPSMTSPASSCGDLVAKTTSSRVFRQERVADAPTGAEQGSPRSHAAAAAVGTACAFDDSLHHTGGVSAQ